MKIFVSIPEEILSENSCNTFWLSKIQKQYPNATIYSSYDGKGGIESADAVLFFYEYRDTKRCKEDMERCKAANIPYNFVMKVYAPSSPTYLYE